MDCDLPAFITEERRKARKPHRCDECHGAIQAGELYDYVAGVWAGEFDWFRICMDCVALRCDVGKLIDDEDRCGVYFGGLSEAINDLEPYEQRDRLRAAFNAVRAARRVKPAQGGNR